MLSKGIGKKLFFHCLIVLLIFSVISPAMPKTASAEGTESDTVDETIQLDPSYQNQPFQGWGTALVWFANITGGWPDEVKNKLADDLFGEKGLNFTIARYNIGGGDSPETVPYMRKGGAVPGYWNRPAEFGPPGGNTENWTEPQNWWNPGNPDHWNWNADANQRWWLKAAKERGADTFEAFSNSAPYFMTQSGYVSGNWDANKDNLKPDQYDNFATYLTTVVDHLQRDLGIAFKTLSPVNEPNTNYWGAKGRQEGSHWSPASQAKIINAVKKQLDAKSLKTVVSAMDETNPQKFREDWDQYDAGTRADIGQLNTHTYSPTNQIGARDIAKGAGKNLWMSEVDLSPGGIGQDFEDIRTGLGLSERVTNDIKTLEPGAWVLWQAVEDEVNMNPQHENGNWGLIQVDFDPQDFSKVKIYKNKKYYAMGNYSKFIRPGDQVINANNNNALAAINKKEDSVVIVYTNNSTEEKSLNFDLSGFGTVKEDAAAIPYITSATDNIAQGASIKISDKKLAATVKPQSITTFVVSGVSGVNPNNSFLNSDEDYNLINKNSGKAMDIAQNQQSIVQKTKVHEKESQSWKIQKVTRGFSSKEVYKVVNTETGKVLGVENGSAVLKDFNENDSSQKWMLSTYGNGEYTLINIQNGRLLEVGGQSKNEDAAVDVWTANAGSNQVWKVVKAGITKIDPVEVTVLKKKTAPVLPEKVTGIYEDGDQVLRNVVWDKIDPSQYDHENIFTVQGTVEGTKLKATATVTVSKIDRIEPIKMKTTPGQAPVLPNEVTAKLQIGTYAKVAVKWDEIDSQQYAELGKFTVRGKIPDSPVKAFANVQVVEPGVQNLLRQGTNTPPKLSASFTGQYDSLANITDGVISSARWTNWDPNTWRPEDWVAVEFDKERAISQVDFYFYDDGGGTRPAESLKLQYWDGSDWKDIDGTQTDVSAKSVVNLQFEPISTTKIRAMMKAMPNTCIAISELMVWGMGENTIPSIGKDTSLGGILINGKPLKDFQSDQTDYRFELNGMTKKELEVEAVTNDLFATAQVEMPESLPGKATIIVTSEDKKHTEEYSIEFVNQKGK
ncbi:hypothetical protein E2K98_22540 [Bacillus salipaludis]|uniref:Ricin B lectin domain-containing protein n=1 Tax=Bacillus salipaludis TaxID=2547811 RepID=A0A4R5VLE6_9BACI|nr:glycoside hydrolase [Bacillus salipaludis]TDK58631.1 hypothetical protein E2K98_22540 [Bacillus salipaludis]